MDVDCTRYRTLESLSTRHHYHHHHHRHQNHQYLIPNSWKHNSLADDIENASMYAVDEIEDECFHTSDFEPFSDDEELELNNRLQMSGENRYQCSSDIRSLNYVIFQSRKPAEECVARYCNGNNFCSGIIYMSEQVNGKF